MSELTDKISRLISFGHRLEAEKELARLLRKNRIEGPERLEMAKLWRLLGRPEKALKSLGPVLSINEIGEYSAFEIELAIGQAHMTNSIGCKYLARRLYKAIGSYLSHHLSRPMSFEMMTYYSKCAHMLLELGELDEALNLVQLYQEQLQKNPLPADSLQKSLRLYHEARSRVHFYRGEISFAICEIKKFRELYSKDNKAVAVIYHNRMATYLIGENKFDEALNHLKEVEQLVGENPGAFVGETVHWYRLMGEWHAHKQNVDLAKSFFSTMVARCKSLKYSPEIIIAGLYEWQKISKDEITLNQHLALRCHPNSNYYSYMAGRNTEGVSKNSLPFWCRKELPVQPTGNCWLIEQEKIKPASYIELREMVLATLEVGEDIFDLQSGVVALAGEFHMLSEIQHQTLLGIVGASELGIDKWSLMEFVYRQTFVDITTGLARQSKIISYLRTLGLKINLDENYYKIELPLHCKIVFPMNFHSLGVWNLLREKDGAINKDILIKTLQVKSETAKRWITEWRKKGFAA